MNVRSLPSTIQDDSGLSLIEILVSMVLVLIIGTVAVSIGSGTLLDAQANQDRARALSYTLEALEQVRSLRDENPGDFFNTPNNTYAIDDSGFVGPYAAFDEENPDTDYLISGQTNFYRVVELTSPDCSDDCKQIHVVTYFTEKDILRSVETTAYLTDWQ